MTTTYDESPNPIENGVQQVYMDIRDALSLILGDENVPGEIASGVLLSLDDAIGNNWDELMLTFWKGARQDIDILAET